MIFRLIVLSLFTLLLIFLDYKKRKNIKKSIFAVVAFGAILSCGYVGFILMRAVAPIFFIHILFVIASYFALIWYLIRDKLYIYIILLPLATIAIYVILNFVDGSRYEK